MLQEGIEPSTSGWLKVYETYALPTELSELLYRLMLSKYLIRYTGAKM